MYTVISKRVFMSSAEEQALQQIFRSKFEPVFNSIRQGAWRLCALFDSLHQKQTIDHVWRYGMKQTRLTKFIIALLLMLTIAAVNPAVYANSAEPPQFTVIVSFPPEDLTLSIRFADGTTTEAIQLEKSQKAWEAYYRFFYWMPEARHTTLEGAALVVQSSDMNFECPLPTSTFQTYNNLLTLNLTQESLSAGLSPVRSALLIFLRVLLTLLIEGLIFFAFGFRSKHSWIVFLIINLLTQGMLNLSISGPILGSYWMIAFVFWELVILIAEMTAFPLILKEHRKGRAAAYAFTANLASLVLGGMLLSFLPI